MIKKIFICLFIIDAIIGLSMLAMTQNIQPIFSHISGATTLIMLVISAIFTYKKVKYNNTIFIISMAGYSLTALLYIMYMYFDLEAINFPLSSFGFDVATKLLVFMSILKDYFILSFRDSKP